METALGRSLVNWTQLKQSVNLSILQQELPNLKTKISKPQMVWGTYTEQSIQELRESHRACNMCNENRRKESKRNIRDIS